MNYQFVMLNANNEPYETTLLGVQLKIRLTTATGTIAYQETHSVITDEFGRANLVIGQGTPIVGTYNGITRLGLHFLDVEVDVTGGSSYQPFTNTQIFPAFKANEVDPLFSASPASGITTTDINNWNNDLGIITETDPIYSNSPAGTITQANISQWNTNQSSPRLKTINQSNHQSITIDINDKIFIDGTITLSSNYTKFNKSRLNISGGTIVGTGQTITVGLGVTFENVWFDSISFSGPDIVFNNCFFENVSDLGGNSTILGSTVNSCNLTINSSGHNFINSSIIFSSIPRSNTFTSCEIENSFLGNFDYSIKNVNGCNNINNALIFVENFTSNICKKTTVRVDNSINKAVISNNSFDEEKTGELFVIVMDRTGSNAGSQINVTDNIFYGSSTSIDHIRIFGTYTDTSTKNASVFISSNTFTRANDVVSNGSTNVHIIFTNNLLNLLSAADIGLSGAYTQVVNNIFLN